MWATLTYYLVFLSMIVSLCDCFLRWLDTKITILLNDSYEVKPHSLISCEMFLMQEIPSSFYVDPYENENLHEFGGPKVCNFANKFNAHNFHLF